MTYSIVVVTWNCAEHLRALVASMNEHLEGDQELVVVDNASTDEPEAVASEWKGPRRFIALDENLGFAAAQNRGVAEASGQVSVMLNPDTELVDAGLDRLATVAGELGGLVGPRVCNSDGSIQASASGPEVGVWPWVRALVPGAVQPQGLLARTEPYRLERRTPVTWLTGACIAGPTATLRRLGPFDPALRMFGEDVDLGLRAAAAGVGSWFDPEACRIVHHGQGSSTLVYGSREGWRPTGTLNWRAAVRRAHGARREYLGWLALRVNLRLRLVAKTMLGRATDRDREAVRAASSAKPVPELDSTAILTEVTGESG
jgi:N-acetylglucosaminyl-diphospho-decaprenol L-rhamnosyltransferase